MRKENYSHRSDTRFGTVLADLCGLLRPLFTKRRRNAWARSVLRPSPPFAYGELWRTLRHSCVANVPCNACFTTAISARMARDCEVIQDELPPGEPIWPRIHVNR